MDVACAWCGKVLSSDQRAGGPVSHGICRACRVEFEYRRRPLAAFLETLPQPTLAVDADARVVEANTALLQTLGDGPSPIGKLGGDVLCCIYAESPEGCGGTVHCVGCAIRRAVMATHETGEPTSNSPAFAYVRTPDGPAQTWFHISTERLADVVLLRIDRSVRVDGDAAVAPDPTQPERP